jgi:hypothetical protein
VRRGAALLLLLGSAAALGAAAAAMSNSAFEGHAAVFGGVALVLAAGLPTAARLRRHGLDGPGLYAAATMFYFGITSLAWLGHPVGAGPGLEQRDIGAALVVVATAIAAFGLGARVLGPSEAGRLCRFDKRDGAPPRVLMIAYLVGLAGVGLAIGLGLYSYIGDQQSSERFLAFSQLSNTLSDLGNIVVLATALTYFGAGDRRLKTPLIIFVAIQVVIGFVGGVKGSTLEPLIFAALAYGACRGRFPWKPIVVVLLITFLFIIPVNGIYRETLRKEQSISTSQALQQAVGSEREATATSVSKAVRDGYDYAFTRFRSIDSVALIVARTPSPYPYASGKEYELLPALILVPRAIWPGKPALVSGGDFSHTYWQIPTGIRTSTPITGVGDLYRNFGRAGVVVGMLIWGVFMAAWTWAYRRWRSPRFDLVYLYSVVFSVTYVESDLPSLVATAAKTLPIAALVAWLLLPGRSSPPGYRRILRASAPEAHRLQGPTSSELGEAAA